MGLLDRIKSGGSKIIGGLSKLFGKKPEEEVKEEPQQGTPAEEPKEDKKPEEGIPKKAEAELKEKELAEKAKKEAEKEAEEKRKDVKVEAKVPDKEKELEKLKEVDRDVEKKTSERLMKTVDLIKEVDAVLEDEGRGIEGKRGEVSFGMLTSSNQITNMYRDILGQVGEANLVQVVLENRQRDKIKQRFHGSIIIEGEDGKLLFVQPVTGALIEDMIDIKRHDFIGELMEINSSFADNIFKEFAAHKRGMIMDFGTPMNYLGEKPTKIGRIRFTYAFA